MAVIQLYICKLFINQKKTQKCNNKQKVNQAHAMLV